MASFYTNLIFNNKKRSELWRLNKPSRVCNLGVLSNPTCTMHMSLSAKYKKRKAKQFDSKYQNPLSPICITFIFAHSYASTICSI